MPKTIIHFILILLLSLSTSFNKCFSQITIVSSGASGNQINIGSAYTQDFNTLPSSSSVSWTDNSTIAGWYVTDERNSNLVTFEVGTGSSTGGNSYSFGSSSFSERAMGYLGSNSQDYWNSAIRFLNNTGSTIQSFSISFTGEQWRSGGTSNDNNNKLTFYYRVFSAGAGSMPTSGTSGWTSVSNLNFNPPQTSVSVGAKDGNSASFRSAKSHSFNVTVSNGQEIYFLWHGDNGAGSDAGLAIDDVSITPAVSTVPVEFIDFDAEHFDDHVLLTWSTASEFNNQYFEIQKSIFGKEFIPIAEVSGNGTTNEIQHYHFKDNEVSPSAFYRLKQVDYDGTYAYSKIIRTVNEGDLVSFKQNNNEVIISLDKFVPSEILLMNSSGREILQDEFYDSYSIDKSFMASGIYVLVVRCNDQIHHYRFVK